MHSRIKKIRQGIAVGWLKSQRNKINSRPVVIVRSAGAKGKIRRKVVVADKYIEGRLHDLARLMKGEKERALRCAKEMSERGIKVGYSEARILSTIYREHKKEFIELSRVLKEIKKARNLDRQKARKQARKIAGKKPSYIDAVIVSEKEVSTVGLFPPRGD